MAITNAQQYQQLLAKGGRIGLKPGGPPGGGDPGMTYNAPSSTSLGPAGGASAGGNYGGNVNVKQEYGGKAYEDQSYATQESIDNAKKREEVRKFQESLENDRKRRARNRRRLEEAALNKKNLFNKLGYIQRTKDVNLEDLDAIDSQGLKIGKFEVPSFISGIGSAFTIDPSTKYFDEDSIREIGSVLSKSKTGITKSQADTLADLREDIQFEDRVLSPDPDDAVSQSEFTDYMNRNKVELPDNDRDNEQQDPCLGPNPPAYCAVNNDPADPATPTRNLGGLAPRFAGSIFDFTGLANGGRAGKMDGGMMDDTPEGGIMDLESGRQMYFLGKLVKKATRAVKKVVKSPIGKAALMYGLGSLGASALGKYQAGTGTGFFSKVKPFLFGEHGGTSRMTKGLLGKFGITSGGGAMKPTLGGGITLGLGIPFALDLLGVGKEEDDNSAYEKYMKDMSLDIPALRGRRNLAAAFDGSTYNYEDYAVGGRAGYQEGGDAEPVAKKTMPLLDMDGMEKDYREDGGFVPIGRMERADDVPARLSKNEFVFTADAVRNAGEGDIDKGAEVMYNMMKNLESGGEVSEESQGLDGAREMFKTSQRLEEVL